MPIDSSIGGVASNSYVSLLEANTYFDSVFGKTLWAAADDATKEQLLISSTLALDTYMDWDGQKYAIDQALDWPRVNAYDKDGVMYSYLIIPPIVKTATLELAYYMLANGGLNYDPNKIEEVKVGSIDVKFSSYVAETGIPRYIEAMLDHVGDPIYVHNGGVYMAKLVRV